MKFFVVSGCALRVTKGEIELMHSNGRVVMESQAEAYHSALDNLTAMYPSHDGWIHHEVVVNEIERQTLADVLAVIDDDDATVSEASARVM